MRAVSAVTLFVCLLSSTARAEDELDVAFAADQKLITSTTIESEGLELRAIGQWVAAQAAVAHQKVVAAQAEVDLVRVNKLFDKNATSRESLLEATNHRDHEQLQVDIFEARIDQQKWQAELWKLRLIESGSGADFRLPLAEALLELYRATLRGLEAGAKQADNDHTFRAALAVMRTKLEEKKAVTAEEAEHARLVEKEKQQITDAIATEIKFLKEAIHELKRTIARLKAEEGIVTPENILPRRLDDARRGQ